MTASVRTPTVRPARGPGFSATPPRPLAKPPGSPGRADDRCAYRVHRRRATVGRGHRPSGADVVVRAMRGLAQKKWKIKYVMAMRGFPSGARREHPPNPMRRDERETIGSAPRPSPLFFRLSSFRFLVFPFSSFPVFPFSRFPVFPFSRFLVTSPPPPPAVFSR